MTESRRPSRRPRSGVVTLSLTLIALGVVLLLQNLGLLPAGFWPAVARLWPVLLVLLGVELLLGARIRMLALLAALLGAFVVATFQLVRPLAPPASGGPTTFEQPLNGATSAAVRMQLGAGRVEVGALPSGAGELASGRLDGPPGASLRPRYQLRDGTGELRLALEGSQPPPLPFFPGAGPAAALDVRLTPDVPLELRAEMGAAEARFDLSELKVSRLDLQSGVSTTWVRLPAAAGTTTGRIRSGAASLELEVPPGVAAQLRFQGGVSRVNVDEARFPLVEGETGLGHRRTYRSPDFERAVNRVDLTLESGASSITVR